MIRLTLPWPSSELSQNARLHYKAHMRSVKTARTEAYLLTKAVNDGSLKDAGSLRVTFTFFPPDFRRRDVSNAFGAMKSASDGISDAIGVDDAKWDEIIIRKGPVEKPGRVEITLEAA